MQSVHPKRRPAYLQDYEVAIAGFKEKLPAVDAIQHIPHKTPDQLLAGADTSPIAIMELSHVSCPSHQRWNTIIDEWHLSPEQSIHQADSVLGSNSSFLVSREPFQAIYQPQPTIAYFRNKDPSEFAHLKMALDNLLPSDSTELFKYQVLVDHLKIEEACVIADSYLHSSTTYTDTILALQKPRRRYQVSQAFTASQLALVDHAYTISKLQAQYRHLSGLPLQPFERAKPLLQVGADHPHPIEPVKLCPPGGPAAVHIRLGWTLQGPTRLVERGLSLQQCLHTSMVPDAAELFQCVEKLWRVDTVPFHREQDCTRSGQDHDVMEMLDTKTVCIEVEGMYRYAMPLLRKRDIPLLRSSEAAVLPRLRSLERKLTRDPQSAVAYSAEIQKLLLSGLVM
ncbi:hypothetical protein SRHO_G00290070 [Serrasalmus rhombeus]